VPFAANRADDRGVLRVGASIKNAMFDIWLMLGFGCRLCRQRSAFPCPFPGAGARPTRQDTFRLSMIGSMRYEGVLVERPGRFDHHACVVLLFSLSVDKVISGAESSCAGAGSFASHRDGQ
jgi:hypothetical protein